MKAKLSIYKAVQAAVIARVCHDAVEGPQARLLPTNFCSPIETVEVLRLASLAQDDN